MPGLQRSSHLGPVPMSDLPFESPPDQKRAVLFVGLPSELAMWLEERLPAVAVTSGPMTEATLNDLEDATFALIVLNYQSTHKGLANFLRWTRTATRLSQAPVLFCLDRDVGIELVEHIVGDLAAAQLLFHPVDREDLARQVATSLGIAWTPRPIAPDQSDSELSAALAEIWEQFRPSMLAGLGVVDQAIADLQQGHLTEELRQRAEVEAHKLAGSVGTSGISEGTLQAREIEGLLRRSSALDPSEVLHLSQLASLLRRELSRPPATELDANVIIDDRTTAPTPRLLIVDDDQALGERLAAEAASRGMHMDIATDFPSARRYLESQRPDVVVLDLVFPEGMAESMALLSELAHRDAPIPVLVLTGRDTFTDRVEVARLGGSGFLQKPVPPAQVIDAVANVLQRVSAAEVKVLAIDDDPSILATLQAMLTTSQVRVMTLSDPRLFWETLEEVSPDLLILDLEMPHLSGIELCRVVRNDPRWSTLPVVFITAPTDAETIHRLFAAGADDYVNKPIVGPDFVARVRNRLDRTQLHRNMAETDPLTGLPNRRKANVLISQYFRQASRNHEHLCLAVVDVDRFKQVNDTYGHLAGDTVLTRLGQSLLQAFRSEDIVARWGGEEFLIAMYGSSRENGVHRVADVLETFRLQEFVGHRGVTFKVTFSGGVAAYPEAGETLQVVFREADAALYAAKSRGRNRLVAAIHNTVQEPLQRLDILGIGDEPDFDRPFIQALETRAYETQWVRDVDTAVAMLGYLPPASHPAVIVLHVSETNLDELGAIQKVVQADFGRCRAILALDPNAETDTLVATKGSLVQRIAPPFTIPKLMQRMRRSLENQDTK